MNPHAQGFDRQPANHKSASPAQVKSKRVGRLAMLALTLGLMPFFPAMAEDHQHDHHHHAMPSVADGYVRTLASYAVPDVKLVDADRAGVSLRSQLDDKPVILNFIFTSCGAICPVMSTTSRRCRQHWDGSGIRCAWCRFPSTRARHPGSAQNLCQKIRCGPQWQMLTGSLDNSIAVQRAFDVYRGDKMGIPRSRSFGLRQGNPGCGWTASQRRRHSARIPQDHIPLTVSLGLAALPSPKPCVARSPF